MQAPIQTEQATKLAVLPGIVQAGQHQVTAVVYRQTQKLTLSNQGTGGNHCQAEASNPPKQNLGKQPPIDM